MASFTVSRLYDEPRSDVFAVFNDIGNVAQISPGLAGSKRENKKPGKGAVRSCDFGKGRGIKEEVTAWKKDELIQFSQVEVWGVPMNHMVADFVFEDIDGKTRVSATMDYDMKMGWLMNPIMKGQLRKGFVQMLDGAATKL
ncbi:MAG: SRPBCC family protein [Thermoplasmatota archaeon]